MSYSSRVQYGISSLQLPFCTLPHLHCFQSLPATGGFFLVSTNNNENKHGTHCTSVILKKNHPLLLY